LRSDGTAPQVEQESPPSRPAPLADALTEPFWAAAAAGVLKVQRCASCSTYFHPPVGLCPVCLSSDLAFVPVSGEAALYSFTHTHSGARHPAFAARTPYLVALVELVEQEGLFFFSNLDGGDPATLAAGQRVHFFAEEREGGAVIPQFRVSPPPPERHVS
jgi:uncharacterized protein